jgi:2-iminobutanoate/2-iminopropanoate deaminase
VLTARQRAATHHSAHVESQYPDFRIMVTLVAGRTDNIGGRMPMPKIIEHVHWPDAPDMWMPYAPAIKVRGGTTVYLAGVTAAPVYHHHPHRPEEFDGMPRTMEGQARAALENLKRGLAAVGATFADIVEADRFVTDLTDQDALNRVWAEYFKDAKPATTTVQVVRLATDPRCLIEINAIAVID